MTLELVGRAMRNALAASFLAAGALMTLPTLIFAEFLVTYDRVSFNHHAAVIRRALPRRASLLLAPLLPLYAIWPPPTVGPSPLVAQVAWLLLGLGLAEIYSACLHREAWIAAFAPELIPLSSRPLGGPPLRPEDRRLQYLLKVQAIYAVAPILCGLVLTTGSGVAPLSLATFFMAKFVAHASTDYEVFFHWHMHCDVLRVRGRPRLTRAWEAIVEWVLGPLYGYLPKVYPAEHMLVHHPESSGPDDLHSPLPYSRTSLLEFCAFAFKTTVSLATGWGILRHPRCRGRHRVVVLGGVVAYWIAVSALLAFGRLLGFWLVAFVLYRGVTAARSQYIWHGLVDPKLPRNPICSTILWAPEPSSWSHLDPAAGIASDESVPSPGTDWAFYDNYHLLHHLHPRAHFSEYPELLSRRLPELLKRGALVLHLRAIDRFVYDCWGGRVDRIAGYVLSPLPVSGAEEFLRGRLRPLPTRRTCVAGLTTSRAGRKMDAALASMLTRLTRNS